MTDLLGETWQANVTAGKTEGLDGKPVLSVAFNPGENAEKYIVFVKCNKDCQTKTLLKVHFYMHFY